MPKKLSRVIDSKIFGGAISSVFKKLKENRQIERISTGLDFRLISIYQKNYDCEIASLCDKYGSDKGEVRQGEHPYSWPSHNYSDFYSRIFWHCRNGVRNVFECGLGTNNPDLPSSMGILGKPGASLRVWRDFFPNAMIYGADIDRDILFHENRIKTFYIDQLDPIAIENFWRTVDVDVFDLMIDDGLHTFEAGSTLFLHSIDRLAPTGIYIIEDVSQKDLLCYQDFFKNKNYTVEYVCLFRPTTPLRSNSMVVIRKKDKR